MTSVLHVIVDLRDCKAASAIQLEAPCFFIGQIAFTYIFRTQIKID